MDSLVLSKPLAAAEPVEVLAARAPSEAPQVGATFRVERAWLAEAVTLRLLGEGTLGRRSERQAPRSGGGTAGASGGFAVFGVDPGRLVSGANRLELESRAAPEPGLAGPARGGSRL